MDYAEFFRQWSNAEEHIVCRTSGSTGTPGTILLPKREMLRSARRTVRFFGLKEGDTLYSCISPDFIGGKMVGVRALLLGYPETGTRFLYERPSNRPLSDVRAEKIDMLSVVPSQMRWLLDHRNRLPQIKVILVGGSAIPRELRREIEQSGLPAWESYGMTETASHIAVRRVREMPEPFIPLDGISVSVEDECLRIDIDGWQSLLTNDLARIDENGGFHILGRRDNMIISGGLKINPEIIEDQLQEYLPHEFAISSREDRKWGERVVLVLDTASPEKYCGEKNAPQVSGYDEIMTVCREHLKPHCVPKEIVALGIPKTGNGKIARRKLHDILRNHATEDEKNQKSANINTKNVKNFVVR